VDQLVLVFVLAFATILAQPLGRRIGLAPAVLMTIFGLVMAVLPFVPNIALAPDLILIGLRVGESDAVAAAALDLVPGATVVAFSCDGRDAYVHDAHAPPAALLDVSPATLVNVIVASRQSALAGRA